jgi:ribosomal protein L37AE/L43A
MSSEEMKIGETVEIHEMGEGTHKLLPEKDIVEFLQSIKECLFCRSTNLRKEKTSSGLIMTCRDCDFTITSGHLYFESRVEEGMKTIRDVVSYTIREDIKKHYYELMEKFALGSIKLERIRKALEAHLHQ